MRYVGIDVHTNSSVWCVLDGEGKPVSKGKVATTAPALRALIESLSSEDELLVGQEVGTLCHFVHDVVTAAGARILSFNAQQLRMIAASRKKTDRRDAYWIAKVLQTGMMPHPVYIPDAPVRRLRALLVRRQGLLRERHRWVLRARSQMRAAGLKPARGVSSARTAVAEVLDRPDGVDTYRLESLELCQRMEAVLRGELSSLDATLRGEARALEAVGRLKTIPAVGDFVALTIYAWVGDVRRFPNARSLASYAGLAPSVYQSGQTLRGGGITKQGSPALRAVLVQAGHVLLWRCKAQEAAPLRRIGERICSGRGRRKVAVVAAARQLLRVAYYVLRDETVYDSTRLRSGVDAQDKAVA